MTKSVTKIQDKDSLKRLSVVRSTEDPTKYWIVILNPDGSKIRWPKGDTGDAATVSVGTTCTWEPGTCACVSNSWDCHNAVLNFTIPKGCKGDTGTAATISVGSTTTLDAGCCANVSNSWTSCAAVLDFCIPKWDKWDTGGQWPSGTISIGDTCTWNPWTAATVTNSGTSTNAVFNFTIPQWVKGETWNAATICVCSTTTLPAGCCATVTNVGNCHCAVLNFAIPQWPQGCQWPIGCTWATWNGIACVTSSKSWKVTTVDISCTNGCSYCFEVCDGSDWEGAWDVLWPASSVDGNVVLFDGISWKLIKDSWKKLPNVVDSLCCNSTTDALSANQGKELKDLIDTYVWLGRFLSLWNATTWLPISFPLTTPYAYKTWDWYMVEIVGTTNYKPDGSSYTGSASTVVDSVNNVEVRDVYIYDGTDWLFQKNNETQVSFSDIAWVPTDNACLCSALGWKQDTLTAWENIEINSNVVSANNYFIIHESDACTTYTGTKWVAPYSTSYCYTNIDINANAWIKWVEWAVYTFVVDTGMIATSACRNVRVRIGDGNYIPVMWSSAILAWNSYFVKTQTRQYQYSTKYQSGGALHLFTDNNTTYSAMTCAEAIAWTCTTWRTVPACVLKQAVNYYAPISWSAYGGGWDGSTDAPTQDAVYDKIEAVVGSIPTIPANVSSFCNDCGYITGNDLPWVATSSCLWVVKIGSDTVQPCTSQGVSCVSCRTYDVQLNSSCQAVVNVPRCEYSCCAAVCGWVDLSLVTTGEKYDWNNGVSSVNTKTFRLSSASDLTTAQDAYDWYVAGKNPIIMYDNMAYNIYSSLSSYIYFASSFISNATVWNSVTQIKKNRISFSLSSWTVTTINVNNNYALNSYLDTSTNYSTPYTPQYDGSPATKKYVDDNAVPSGWTCGQVLTNIWSGCCAWCDPSGWSTIEAFTQQEYNDLPASKDTDGVWRLIYE